MCSVATQNGSSGDDHLGGAVAGANGTYVFAGSTRGDWSGANAGGYDWAVFKVDDQGDILWSWQVTYRILNLSTRMYLSRTVVVCPRFRYRVIPRYWLYVLGQMLLNG